MKALERPEAVRQSLIAQFDRCPLSTRFALETEQRQPSRLAARGTLGHRFFAVALEWMVEHTEPEIPVDVAMDLLQEVIAQRDIPDDEVVHLPMSELRWLRVLATKFAYGHSYHVERVVGIERRLYATIPCRGTGGEVYERQISGQLDVLLASPPDGAIVVDYKTGFAPAPQQREQEDMGLGGARNDTLSDMGFAQQIVYGFLVLMSYPSVQWVALREFYVMSNEVREARVERWQMERIQDVLAALVSQLDAAIDAHPALVKRQAKAKREGRPIPQGRWFAVGGDHCSMCPRPRDCPIRDEVAAPASAAEAEQIAQEWVVAKTVAASLLPFLKGWVDRHGPIVIRTAKGRQAVGWVANKTGGGRTFRLHRPEGAAQSPFDPLLAAAAREAGVLERG